MLLLCGAFSWWLQPQGEQNVRLQTWKRHALALLLPSACVRYRGALPEARTKQQAEQAESKIKQEIFEKRFEVEEKGIDLRSDFLDDVYLPWSKVNKKSWRDDVYMVPMLKAYFEGKALRDISVQLVERFKTNRMIRQLRREQHDNRQR